jgi:hypothetical protein
MIIARNLLLKPNAIIHGKSIYRRDSELVTCRVQNPDPEKYFAGGSPVNFLCQACDLSSMELT